MYNQLRFRNIKIKLCKLLGFIVVLSTSTLLLAQSQVRMHLPDNLPLKKTDNTYLDSNSDSPDNTGQRARISSLTRQCKAVETGNTAAFKTVLIPQKYYAIPIINVHADWMPPEPSNPDSTIVGIDSDGDCVRDDIERYIGKLFRDKDQQRKRKYLFEYAKWLGIFIKIRHWSIETTRTIYRNLYKAAECVRRIHGDRKETRALLDNLFAEFHNTHNRSVRYIRNNAKLGGWVTRENIPVSCR